MTHHQLLDTLDILVHKRNEALPENCKELLLAAQAETLLCSAPQQDLHNSSLQKKYQRNRAAGLRMKTIGEELERRLSDFTPYVIGLYQLRPFIKLPYWLPIIISADSALTDAQKALEHHGFKKCRERIPSHNTFPAYGNHFQRNAFSVSLLHDASFVKRHHFEAAKTDRSKELLLLLDIVLTQWLQQSWSQTWYVTLLISCMMYPQALDILASLETDHVLLGRLIEELQQHCAHKTKSDSLFQDISQFQGSSVRKLYFLYLQRSLTIELLFQTLRRNS